MVEFGKKLRAQQVPEWKDHYISYKMMKKKLKEYARLQQPRTKENHKRILKEFSEMLDSQIEKVVLFLLQRQGELAAELARLGDGYEPSGGMFSTDEAHEVCCNIGRELLKLLHFLEVNAVGLRKILKKFDKHIGYKLTDYYVTSRSNHPYSQLQQVFKHVGIGAMVGALSRKFAQLQHQRNSLISIYDAPTNVVKEPVLEAIGAAQERLSHSTSFLQFLAQHALIIGNEFPRSPELPLLEKEYHFMSLFLNLANTFLYMVNTYIVVPTADNYAMSLGAAPTFCGVIIGSMAVAQLVSSVYFSAWSNRSYFRPLLFSSVMLLLGNVFYGIAFDLRSLTVLIVGRILCGLGSARAVNRRYISDCVPLQSRLKASAAFVSASALGMACGPALAVAFETEKVMFGMTFNSNTLPGWAMAAGWLLYLLLLWLSFKEPLCMLDENGGQTLGTAGVNVHDSERAVKIDSNLLEPLHSRDSFEHEETKGEDEAEGEDDADSEDSRKPANSIKDAYKLLTFPVKVQLLIYFMLKYVMEILISESSVVTEYYFQWTTREIALFLAVLGLTVLPVNAVVGGWLSNIFEDRQILLVSEVFVCLGVLISFAWPVPYTIVQYVGGALLMFVAAEVLEGVNLSLLSKVMSSRLARGTWNGGLLSTEAGTIARVIADSTITLAGYLGISKLLNATLLPSLIIGIVSSVLTFVSYNSLF